AARIQETPLAEVKNKKPGPKVAPTPEPTPEAPPQASAPKVGEKPQQTTATARPKKPESGERETAWPAAQPN
ncbi:MAG: hypothetical protein WEB60_06060, partial [Terrimicrobiaceae bacterium]